VVAALIGWAIVVGASGGAAAASSGWLGLPPLGRIGGSLHSGLVVVGALLWLWLMVLSRGGGANRSGRRRRWPLVLAALVVVVLLARTVQRADDAGEAETVSPSEPPPDRPVELPGAGDAALVLMLLVVAAAAFAATGQRIGGAPLGGGEDTGGEPQLGEALAGAASVLAVGDDPRSAVVLAYAGLEKALAADGSPRQSHETAAEHVRRVLAGRPLVADPVGRLAGLYEIARFSQHPVTVGDQRAAADALARAMEAMEAEVVEVVDRTGGDR
jgi:hypothetical protein